MSGGLILLFAVIALTSLSLLVTRRKRQRASTTSVRMQSEYAQLREHAGLRDSMNQLYVQLEELARHINAQCDTKFAKLDTVVCDADERIARLEALLSEVKEVRPSTAPAPPLPENSRIRRIYALADDGLAPIKIAEEVGLPLGEVQLALDLRRFA